MAFLPNRLKVIDNSGASEIKCIKILKKSPKSCYTVGDIVVGVVSRLKKSQKVKKVKQGEIIKGLVVTVKKNKRYNGFYYVKFPKTSVILLNKQDGLLGTRILEPITRELRSKGFSKVVSIAKIVI